MTPVKSKLDLVIAHLEAERKALKRMIKEATAEHDNLIVYYHSEALLDLDRRLEILYNFKDPDYNRKKELNRRIDFIKKMSFSEFREPIRNRMKQRNAERILEFEEDLQKLIDKPAKLRDDTQIIDDALFALVKKQCKSFKLMIDDEENFGLHLVKKKNLLVITLVGLPFDEEPDFVMIGRSPRKLEGLGFQIDTKRNKCFRTFELEGLENFPIIKQWLARFMIDFCGLSGQGNNIHIVYK